jgi:hypothetical protein
LLKKSDESALAEMQYHPTINADWGRLFLPGVLQISYKLSRVISLGMKKKYQKSEKSVVDI